MLINKIVCMQCHGRGHETVWRVYAQNADGTGMAKTEEATCGSCSGKGYAAYPVFTVDEAKVIAKHFGFSVTGDDND